MRVLAVPQELPPAESGTDTAHGTKRSADDDADDDGEEPEDESYKILVQSVSRLKRQQATWLVQTPSFGTMKLMWEQCPLALVRSSAESGNVMILMDCNVWGQADHRPDIRPCPMSAEKFDIPLRSLIAARCGTSAV